MVQITVGTSIVLGALAVLLSIMWEKEEPKPPLALDAQRVAKIEAPEAIEFEKKEVKKQKEEEAEKSTEKEGQTKRAKEKAGRIGRNDATPKDTIIPKGKEDILREKVQKVGILSIIGRDKAPGSGLSKLFAQSNDVEQAMAGMAGAKMVVGHGAGGFTTSGSGRAAAAPATATSTAPATSTPAVAAPTGTAAGPSSPSAASTRCRSAWGRAAATPTARSPRSRSTRSCKRPPGGREVLYEKELQHKASLSGGVDIFWVIQPDGTVSKANVKRAP